MAAVQTYSCDNCSKQRGQTERWFKAFLLEADKDNKPAGFLIIEWEVDTISRPKELGGRFIADRADGHLCGTNCLMEWISKKGLETS